MGKINKILTPKEWVEKVQGKSYIEYMEEDGLSVDVVFQFMEWYADYAIIKYKQNQKRKQEYNGK